MPNDEEPTAFKYRLELTSLDVIEAAFKMNQDVPLSEKIRIVIPVAHWVTLGRPGEILVNVGPYSKETK